MAAVVLGVTAVLGSQIPQWQLGRGIHTDPTPEKLLASFPSDQQRAEEFRATFQESDKVLVLLVQANDVFARRPLQYLHDLSLHFRDQDWVERAQSMTIMPLPRTVEENPDELSLEQLEHMDEQGASDCQNPVAGRGDALQALSDLVDSDPDRFVDGYGGLLARFDSCLIRTDTVIQGDRVTDEEANDLRNVIAHSPLVQGRLVSADGKVAVVVLHLAGDDIGHKEVNRAVTAVRAYLHEHRAPNGVSVVIGGLPYIRLSIVENMRSDQRVLIPATLVVCMVLLFLSFRWIPGIFLPIVAAGITVAITLGGMALAGEPMNVINNIIPPLLIIIGITAAIHVIQRYREETQRTGDPAEGRRNSVRAMGVAVLLTSLTTSVGMGSLLTSQTEMLRRFGVIAGIGVMVVYVVSVTFLPAVLCWFRPPPAGSRKHKAEWLEAAIVLLTRWVLRRSWLVLAGTLVLLGVLVWGASNVNIDHALLDQFDPNTDVYRTTRLMEDKLDGVRPLEVVLQSPRQGRFYDPQVIARMDKIERWARARPEVLSTMGHSDIMHEGLVLLTDNPTVRGQPFRSEKEVRALHTLLSQREPNPLDLFLNTEGTRARIQLKVRDVGAKATLKLIDELEKQIGKDFHGLGDVTASFAGDAYTGSRGLTAVIGDLLGSLLTAVGIIFILLVLLFRNLRLAILSIPPYVIPLVGTMAYMAARGIPLNATTVIIFSISIGMAVDGSIHLLQRFREETGRGFGTGVALLRSARGTGRAIAVSCFTLIIGFGVLMLSSFVPVRHFGELIAVTIGTCLFSTLVIQPALLKVGGVSRRAAAARSFAASRSAPPADAGKQGDGDPEPGGSGGPTNGAGRTDGGAKAARKKGKRKKGKKQAGAADKEARR